jgi:hypothetical protein
VSLLDRVRVCQVFDPAAYRPFVAAGRQVGRVRHELAEELRRFAVFDIDAEAVRLRDSLAGPADRTAAMAEVCETLMQEGRVRAWRGEPYPVATSFSAPQLFTMERAAVPLFGVRGYGVHLNGIVEDEDGGHPKMWIGVRALDKPTGPGKLDQMVAGGLPAGIGVLDNLVKECAEEADVPEALARRAQPVGVTAYVTEREEGLRDDVLFNYDLSLPPDFVPRNTDGEVERFELKTIDEVVGILETSDAFKFNTALVAIDFLVRRGLIGPEHPDYVELVRGLHGG